MKEKYYDKFIHVCRILKHIKDTNIFIPNKNVFVAAMSQEKY